jgi:hypothetical protein
MAKKDPNTLHALTKDLTGQRFGRLVALSAVRNPPKRLKWLCICDCGKQTIVSSINLSTGHTKSCGCYAVDCGYVKNVKHRMSHSRECRIWYSMKQRCTNPNNSDYERYGGRGIKICDRWLNSFEAFYVDMGPCPTRVASLDRYPDMNGNYEPGNCRWGTPTEQANNRRTNRFIEWGGQSMTLADACRKADRPMRTVWARLKAGWTVDDALTTPIREAKKRCTK